MEHTSYNIATVNINTITNDTKLNSLRSFIRTMELDIVFLQEVENEQLSLPGYNVICNVDHSRRGTAIALKEYISFSHVEKSLDGRLLTVRINDTTLANVYAPSGTQFRAERERFLNNTIAYYLRHNTPNLLLAGDFNCVIRQCDATGPNYSPALQATVRQLQLKDAWEQLKPQCPGHTYITANSTSRLDRVYVSAGLREQLRSADVHVCSFTDHKAVTIRICLPHLGREPGRGFWCLRPHLLTVENIEEFRYRWQYITRQRRYYTSWMSWWIAVGKPKIKSFFKWKSKAVFEEFNREHQRLYSQLREAYDNYYGDPAMITTINMIKGRMLAHQRNFTKIFVRINETYVAGEALSSFQLGERRRKRTTITQLRDGEDVVINRSEDIQQHIQQYFQTLYTEEPPQGEIVDDFGCPSAVPENDPENESCMRAITTEEILTAIKRSASRKSPGADGIPKEFYLRCFDVVHRELNLTLNEALAGDIPEEFVDGVIVLVKKKGADETIRAYRPISLLNYDYKILSRVLKARLEAVVRTHHILSDAQKCANPNRNIFQATLSLKDRVAQLIHRKLRGKLVSFDLDHAFDRVRLPFLFGTMCSLGINRQLVDLLSRIASRSSSRLLVNGYLSAAFPIQRSVRQGCPLSMLLFVLYLHPLLSRLEQLSGEDLVIAYADDISIICTSVQKLEMMRDTFARFELVSGAKLNWQKTNSIDVGFIEGNPLPIPWLQTTNTIKILGIVFANSIRLMTSLNWNEMVRKFSQHIWLHSLRALDLHQKVILLNTFITSKIWYLASNLSPYGVHTAKITAVMGTFLWSRAPARIPMCQLARKIPQGGLNLQLCTLKCKSLLVNRHLQEIDSIEFYKSFLVSDNPNQVIPADLPDLKLVRQQCRILPEQVTQNPSSLAILSFYLDQIELPRVERNRPNNNWKRAWRAISSKRLNSSVRGVLYMFVNGKTEHREFFNHIGRADGENCLHCGATTETLQHKFSECRRVIDAWTAVQRKISSVLGGWRHLSFEDFMIPILPNIELSKRIRILNIFSTYIKYINEATGIINIPELEFLINNELA